MYSLELQCGVDTFASTQICTSSLLVDNTLGLRLTQCKALLTSFYSSSFQTLVQIYTLNTRTVIGSPSFAISSRLRRRLQHSRKGREPSLSLALIRRIARRTLLRRSPVMVSRLAAKRLLEIRRVLHPSLPVGFAAFDFCLFSSLWILNVLDFFQLSSPASTAPRSFSTALNFVSLQKSLDLLYGYAICFPFLLGSRIRLETAKDSILIFCFSAH